MAQADKASSLIFLSDVNNRKEPVGREQTQKMDEFLQEFFNADQKDEDAQFITKWVVIAETQDLEGNKTIAIRKSNTPPWDALGLMDWATETFKIRHRHRGEL